MSERLFIALLSFASFLGSLRIIGMKGEAFQAVAHLFVGALLGSWAAGRDYRLLALAAGLSILELVAFFTI